MKHRLITILLIITLLTSVGIGNVCAGGLRDYIKDYGTCKLELAIIDPDEDWVKLSGFIPKDIENRLRFHLKQLHERGYYMAIIKYQESDESIISWKSTYDSFFRTSSARKATNQ